MYGVFPRAFANLLAEASGFYTVFRNTQEEALAQEVELGRAQLCPILMVAHPRQRGMPPASNGMNKAHENHAHSTEKKGLLEGIFV